MQTLKQAPTQHKGDSIEEIATLKISRTLWEPSSLAHSVKRKSYAQHTQQGQYGIEKNEITAYLSTTTSSKRLIKEVFAPWRIHNMKTSRELRFCPKQASEIAIPLGGVNFSFETFGRTIASQFKNLQTLHLNNCGILKPQDIEKLSVQVSRNLQNLKCLKLNFNYSYRDKLPEKHLQNFISEISKNLTGLKKLHFYFQTCDSLTAGALRELTHDICRYLRGLEHLSFHFENCSIIEEETEKFMLGIGSSFPRLKYLKLRFENFMHLGMKSMEAFNYLLDQHSTHLKGLSLDLGAYSKIRCGPKGLLKDEDYEELVKNIAIKLKDLQKLGLNLTGSNWITDQELKGVRSGMSFKKNTLQQIKLKANCKNITNVGFDHAMIAIANHSSVLQVLKLDFSGCQQIGSNALRTLIVDVIKPSQKLKKLKLNFDNCKAIRGKGLEELLVAIVNKKESWESVTLNFASMGSIGNSKDKVNQLLASCPLIKWKIYDSASRIVNGFIL